MRILFVLAYYHPYIGGAERIFKSVAEGLVERGHEVRVITTLLANTPAHEVFNGVTIKRVQVPQRGDRYFFSLLSLPAVLKEASWADLLHTTAYNGAPPAFLAARIAQRPIVFTALEVLGQRWAMVEPAWWKAWGFRAFEQMVVRLPYDATVSISNATQRDLHKAGARPRHPQVIYCGIDEAFARPQNLAEQPLRRLCGAETSDFVYVYAGRPGVTKGVEYLLRAAPAIQQQIPSAHLALVMAHEPYDQYQQLAALCATLSGDARIHLIAPTLDRKLLASYLCDANCVVVPSLTEGFGLSAVETCTLGVPLVATRAGSLPEVVFGQHILVEPGSAEAISRAVVRVSQGDYDPYIEPRSYCWEDTVVSYEALYQEMLPCSV